MLKILFIFLLFLLSVRHEASPQIFASLYGEGEAELPQIIRFKELPAQDFQEKKTGYLDRFDHAFKANQRYPYLTDLQKAKLAKVSPDLLRSWIAAELSLLSYNHPQFIEKILVRYGFKQIRYFQGNEYDGQGFVAYLKGVVYVCFRGTEPDSFTDMVSDIKFALTTFEGEGKVHTGFLSAYKELESNGLAQYLKFMTKTHPNARLVFCGHSLGGAMATLASTRYPEKGQLITFGSPRVGNRKFSRWFPVEGFRFSNLADPVTHVPPSFALTGGYRHVGQTARMLSTSIRFKGVSVKQNAKGALSVFKSNFIGKIESLFDHAPTSYALKLRAAVLGPLRHSN